MTRRHAGHGVHGEATARHRQLHEPRRGASPANGGAGWARSARPANEGKGRREACASDRGGSQAAERYFSPPRYGDRPDRIEAQPSMLSGMEPRALPSSSAPRPPLRPLRVCPFCREGARLWCARAVLRTNEWVFGHSRGPTSAFFCCGPTLRHALRRIPVDHVPR